MQKKDLGGRWLAMLDEERTGAMPRVWPDRIDLPGTTSAAGLGPENPARETGYLTDSHAFSGHAWFRRTFDAGDWAGKTVLLTLERTRKTRVWLDGAEVGSGESLCTPHCYVLPGLAAGSHTLTLCVDNMDYPTRGGHLTAPDTQGNWNGVTGEISLTVGEAIVTGVRTCWLPECGALRVQAEILGQGSGTAALSVNGGPEKDFLFADGALDAALPLPEGLGLWDEYTPTLHTLTVRVGGDRYETTFGLRRLERKGRRLLINGREVFLRGKHDALLFPLTGYAPTDVASWLRVLGTAKEYGINHYRFHTCCPPEAAFTAADRLGIYLSPELPFWGTVKDEGEEDYDARERGFLIAEGFAMLRAFGHHPSFVMMSLGNELWGSKDALNRMLRDYRAYAPDKWYISGANNFQFVPDVLAEEDLFVGVRLGRDRLLRGSYAMCDAPQGIVQVTEPESVRNYDAMIVPQTSLEAGEAGRMLIQYGTGVREVRAEAADALIPQVPIITHEVGQYEFYPDFDEIDRYTGPMKARNLEVFRERLQAAGLWDDHDRFFRAAGKLAVACYRREIETALRSRELSGFQLLDLQDYTGQGTALVGILNSMMESKGFITPVEWRRFCADTVVLGEFDRFLFAAGEPVAFGVRISCCDPCKVYDCMTCTLLRGDRVLAEHTVTLGMRRGRLTDAVRVDLDPVEVQEPETLTVRLALTDGTMNEYPIWVFPQAEVSITPAGIRAGACEVRFVQDAAAARDCPGQAIVIPDAAGKLPAEYCSDFWCYPMFRSISEGMGKPVPTGTLGLCIDPGDPLLAHFPTDGHTTPPWYPILAHAHIEPTTDTHPPVQMIDNTERCSRFGVLYREHGALHLTARLWEAADDPAVRAFALSLVRGLCGGTAD